MNRQECADKYYNDIMRLQGLDEFKDMVKRLKNFQQNKEKYSISDVSLPNYFWIAKRGGGISTCLNALAEYLYNTKVIEFTGNVKFFEYRLAYIAPNEFFSELTRLNNTISEIAGHHRFFRGIACINIGEWVQRTNEYHFLRFLDYIANKNDKILVILFIHSDNKREVENIESSLSSRIRFETLWLRFPDAEELVEFIEGKYFKPHDFYLSGGAKNLLKDSIDDLIGGQQFNGFMTIKQLSNDILYNLLTSSIENREISKEMLLGFARDSAYIKRIKTFAGISATIGFDASLGDCP
jgi:hypothetical protein